MNIVLVKIKELKPAEYNPRQLTEDQHKRLKESIVKFGMVDPIIANKHLGRENVVIGGHMRLKICEELGQEDVPVYFVDLNLEKEKELNIRLNKNTGEWNFEALGNNFDLDFLKNIGFSEAELDLSEPVKKGKVSISIHVPEDAAADSLQKIENALKGVDIKIRTRKI